MTRIARHGIDVDLPPGWDARIYQRTDPGPTGGAGPHARASTTHAVLHAANFPLPALRGDYGSGAVEVMRPTDVLLALVEFHPDSAGTPLFAARGLPRSLPVHEFGPQRLQRTIPGQAGTQRFFTEAGRAFCLYAVLGSYARRTQLVPDLDRLLAGVVVEPGAAS